MQKLAELKKYMESIHKLKCEDGQSKKKIEQKDKEITDLKNDHAEEMKLKNEEISKLKDEIKKLKNHPAAESA